MVAFGDRVNLIMRRIDRRSFLGLLPGAVALAGAQQAGPGGLPNRPKVPGTLLLRTRRRAQGKVSGQELTWPVARTAIILCDMWDAHTCALSAQRVALMAPRMNRVVSAARSLGVMIIHAPSDTMPFYEGTPWRQRMKTLKDLGFIDAKTGASGDYHYVLILNPHIVLRKLKAKIQTGLYMRLFERGQEIGATDLTDSPAPKPSPKPRSAPANEADSTKNIATPYAAREKSLKK